MTLPSQNTAARYELVFDQLDETYTIKRTEVYGPFASREEARQFMLDRSAGGDAEVGQAARDEQQPGRVSPHEPQRLFERSAEVRS